MKIFMTDYDGLTKPEQECVSDNGCGKEWAGYLVIERDGEREVYSDAMESEDARFCRDLSWVVEVLKEAYGITENDN